MAGLVLEKVSRVYSGSVVAVDALSLDVADGELVVLVGPSGSGKSTTLRLIAGLERPTGGQIRIDGRAVDDTPPRERNIAMVFQNDALYPHLTVLQNIEFAGRLRAGGGWLGRIFRHTGRAEADASGEFADQRHAARQMAERLGVGHLLDRWPRQLSGGERQRVGLARALLRQPALFLFDEPLSNLDAPLRTELRCEIKRLQQSRRATMVYVTHDQVEALTLGERIVVLDRGELQQVGTPVEVYQRPRNLFVARFFGSVPMNLVAGRVEKTARGWGFRRGDWLLELDASSPGGQVAKPSRGDSLLRSEESEAGAATSPTDVSLQQYLNRPPAERPVVLGVRPEQVGLRAVKVDAAPAGLTARGEQAKTEGLLEAVELCGTVEMVESLGDSAVVTVAIGPAESCETFSLVSKSGPQVAWRAGDAVALTVDPARVQLFDAVTGMNVSRL